ncbi:hypothetical protein LguiB_023973 [Lonicera macranthoides]
MCGTQESKELCKGLVFKDKNELQKAVKAYSIKIITNLLSLRPANKRIMTLVCKLRNIGCPWQLVLNLC